MKTLDRLVLQSFFVHMLVSLGFFTLIVVVVDLFVNIQNLLESGATLIQIATVELLHVPEALSLALPVGMLFAVSYTIGTFYGNNELIAVFASGRSLFRFVLPMMALGLLTAIGGFFFEELVVIDAQQAKQRLVSQLTGNEEVFSQPNVTAIADEGRTVYQADYYNDANRLLSRLVVVERDETGSVRRRIDAEWAEWNGDYWTLRRARVFDYQDGELDERFEAELADESLDTRPSTFQSRRPDVGTMHLDEAWEWVQSLREAGLSYRIQLTRVYERFSFALTPFVVVVLSSAIGGRFRKNVLALSLISSLAAAIAYYGIQIIGGALAYTGVIQPVAGAWLGIVFFALLSIFLFSTART